MNGETARYTIELIATSNGEVPSKDEFAELVKAQMAGKLDEDGLEVLDVTVTAVSGELEPPVPVESLLTEDDFAVIREEEKPSGSEHPLHEVVQGIYEWNSALGEGISETLVGRHVTAVTSAEVWSGSGDWSLGLSFDDGSTLHSDRTLATGPLAEIVRMGGGDPDGVDD